MAEEFILAPGEEFVQCPYSQAHRVTNARLIFHLDKCRANYYASLPANSKQSVMDKCPFNWTHQVPKVEMPLHIKICPNRDNEGCTTREPLDLALLSANRSNPPPTSSYHVAGGEDWESETTGAATGYDPSVKLQREIVISMPAGLKKSERKEFRRNLKERAAKSGCLPFQLAGKHSSVQSDYVKLEETKQQKKIPVHVAENPGDEDKSCFAKVALKNVSFGGRCNTMKNLNLIRLDNGPKASNSMVPLGAGPTHSPGSSKSPPIGRGYKTELHKGPGLQNIQTAEGGLLEATSIGRRKREKWTAVITASSPIAGHTLPTISSSFSTEEYPSLGDLTIAQRQSPSSSSGNDEEYYGNGRTFVTRETEPVMDKHDFDDEVQSSEDDYFGEDPYCRNFEF